MVFLRLEVKVFPREQATASPGLFRSLIGSNADRARDEDPVPKKCASFLLTVEKPEDVTLGDLACLILDEWRLLRPDEEALAIKKLLDDANPSVDLNVGFTVEDVFVDRGKARADGHDQRAVVRVIQKPAAHCPERFPSVVQDWDGAVQESQCRRSKTKEAIAGQFSPIEEEDAGFEDAVMQDSPIERGHRDIPVSSVETHDTTAHRQAPTSDAVAGTPPRDGFGSEELGSPGLSEQNQRLGPQPRKRKHSPEKEAPVKNPRLEDSSISTQDLKHPTADTVTEPARISTPSPLRKRSRIPSFASPHNRRPSITEKPSDARKHGLGLGITKSPPGPRKVMLDMPSSEPSLGPSLFPSSAHTASTPKDRNLGSIKQPPSLQSAMRKQTPLSKAHSRRSVSFINGHGVAEVVNDEALSTPQESVPIESSQGATASNSGTPSSSRYVYPPGFSQEKIDKIRAQIEQESQEIESVQKKLKDPNTDPRCLTPLRELSELFPKIKSYEGKAGEKRKLRDLHKKQARLRKQIQDIENEASKTETPPTEPPLPPSASKVDRSIPITTHNTQSGLSTDPTWSFGSTSQTEPHCRSSVASNQGTRDATGTEHAHNQPAAPETESAVSSSKAPSRKSPVKADIELTHVVMIHTPPSHGSKVARTQRQPSKSPSKRPQSIEISSDENEESSEDEAESEDEDEDEDKDEDDGEGETIDNTAAPGSKSDKGMINGIDKADEELDEDEGEHDEEMVDRPAKDPVQSCIDDEADEQEDDEDEEDGEGSEESEEKDESADESSDESVSDMAEAKDGIDRKPDQGSYSEDDKPEVDLPPRSSQPRIAAKSPAQGPSHPTSLQRTPTQRATLKGLIQSQRAEQAARQKQSPVAAPKPQAKDDIYTVPSSSESESNSDSDSDESDEDNSDQEDMGDILPNGESRKMRPPYAIRK